VFDLLSLSFLSFSKRHRRSLSLGGLIGSEGSVSLFKTRETPTNSYPPSLPTPPYEFFSCKRNYKVTVARMFSWSPAPVME